MTLQTLLDERAVERLFSSYFERVDANDPVGAAAHMTEDVAFEVMIGQRREGRDRFARALGRVLDGYTATSHHVTNFVAQLDGGEGSTSMYVYAFHRMASTGEPWHLWARIHDRVRREGGERRISEPPGHGLGA